MTRIFIGLIIAMTIGLWLMTDGFDHPVMVKLKPEPCLPGKCSYDQ